MKPSVFISHATKNTTKALQLVEIMESSGLTCWIATRDTRPGEKYDEEIEIAIKKADYFVLLLSSASNSSEHVKRELSLAAEQKIKLRPVRIEAVTYGSKLSYFLSTTHWFDACYEYERSCQILALTLKADHSKINIYFDSQPNRGESPKPKRSLALYVLFIVALGLAIAFAYREYIFSTNEQLALMRSTGIEKVHGKANDFLPYLGKYISEAQDEIWFVGMSFYITLPQYRDDLIKKLDNGVSVRFLILDPNASNFASIAKSFNQSEEELRSECDVTLSNLTTIRSQWLAKTNHGRARLEIRLFSSIPKSRMYLFDRSRESGYIYFIPHIENQNSPNLPGFLVKNSKTGIAPPYIEAVETLWNQGVEYEKWIEKGPAR